MSRRTLRLLAVGSMYPPHHLGGYELAWKSWVEHAVAAGHQVEVLASDLRLAEAEGAPDPPAAPVERSLRWYWRDHAFPRLNFRARLAIERHNAAVLGRKLAAVRPDAVVWWPMGGMSMGLLEGVRRAGIASVGMVCDDWLLYGPRVDAWQRIWRAHPGMARAAEVITRVPTRVDLPRAARYLFLSDTLRRRAREEHPALAQAEVAHRGPEAHLFSPAPEAEWRGRLLYSGRIDPRKGIDLAIAALAELEDATLTIDGPGDPEHVGELRRLADLLGVAGRVRFTRSPRERLQRAYAEADAVVFPVRWEEPWGLVPLEAMAVGRPVVATGVGGSAEYLSGGENCLLFEVEDGATALAARVRELAGEPGLRRHLREGGFATARNLSAERFNEQVLAAVARAAEEGVGADGRN